MVDEVEKAFYPLGMSGQREKNPSSAKLTATISICFFATFLMSSCALKRSVEDLVKRPPLDQTKPIGVAGPYYLVRQLVLEKSVPVGSYPKSVTIAPDGERAYVCNLEGGSVDVFSTASFKRIFTLRFIRTYLPTEDGIPRMDRFEEKPVETAFTQDGRYVWISLLRANGVAVYDTREAPLPANARTKRIRKKDPLTGRPQVKQVLFLPTGEQPKVLAVTPDEKYVFVANWRGETITVIDAHRFNVVKTIHTGANPRGICFVGNKGYVANFGSNTISEINLSTLRRTRTLTEVGKNPRHLIAGLDGRSLYVSNHGDGRLRRIDLASGKVSQSCKVETEPRTICLSAHRNFIFAVNYKSDSVSVVDRVRMKEVLRIPTLHRPVGVALDPRKDELWVTGYLAQTVNVYRFRTTLRKSGNRWAMGSPD